MPDSIIGFVEISENHNFVTTVEKIKMFNGQMFLSRIVETEVTGLNFVFLVTMFLMDRRKN